jgi:hypothetical protein
MQKQWKKQNKSVVATADNAPGSLRSRSLILAVPHFKRCYGCQVVNGQEGVLIIFFIDELSAPFNGLKTGMRGGGLDQW